VERYNSITSETSLSEVLAKEQQSTAAQPQPQDVLANKTNIPAAGGGITAHPSHLSLASKGKGSSSQVDMNSPYLGPQDTHLSADQPRYFPGVVTRGQRKNSKRQDSVREE
jgi:AMP deaminase